VNLADEFSRDRFRAALACKWGEHPMEVLAPVCHFEAMNFIIRCVHFSSFVRGAAGVAPFRNLHRCLFGG
jgi:hypothetical protein